MAPGGARDVLVVDDDAAIRKMMEIRLGRLGLTSDAARDGLEALNKIRQAHYDVILVDLMMPRLDGAEFVRRLAEDEMSSGERPVVLLMSASAEIDDFVSARGRIHAVIAKPFDVMKLGELVRDCVQSRRALRARSATAPTRRQGSAESRTR